MPEYDLVRIQQRHRTAAGWVAVNEVLGVAEIGVESDTGLLKVGDGVTPWNNLPHREAVGPPGPPGYAGTAADETSLPASAAADELWVTLDTGHQWRHVGGVWVDYGPYLPSGVMLASTWPTTVATQTATTGAPTVFPELMSPEFPMPSRPVRVRVGSMVVQTPATAASLVLRYQTHTGGDWGPWVNLKQWYPHDHVGGNLRFAGDTARLPYPGASALEPGHLPAPGDMVRVKVDVDGATTGDTVRPVVFLIGGLWAGFDVETL